MACFGPEPDDDTMACTGRGPGSIDMGIWLRLHHWFAGNGSRPPSVVRDTALVDGELPQDPEPPWGCGWFDSSLDLRHGLAVIEHGGLDVGLAIELLFDGAAPPHCPSN